MRVFFSAVVVLGIGCNEGSINAPGDGGAAGAVGPVGPAGPAGVAGPQGVAGAMGVPGTNGISCWDLNADHRCSTNEDTNASGDCTAADCVYGMSGSQGPQGVPGAPGLPGVKGDKGDKGDTGNAGGQGVPGVKGDKGDPGSQGTQGVQGIQGLKGDAGAKGDPGSQGVQGIQGVQGPAGPSSIDRCPAGMAQVDLGYSKVCFVIGVIDSFNAADQFCADSYKAPLCTLAQWRALVCRAGAISATDTWINSIGGSGAFGVARACTGSDQVSVDVWNSKHTGVCCLEWMNY